MIPHLHYKNLLKIMFPPQKIANFSNYFQIMYNQEYKTFLKNTNLSENFFFYMVWRTLNTIFAQGRKHRSTFHFLSFTGLNLKRCVRGQLVSLPYV